jgi:hypothetical protein
LKPTRAHTSAIFAVVGSGRTKAWMR